MKVNADNWWPQLATGCLPALLVPLWPPLLYDLCEELLDALSGFGGKYKGRPSL
jgi:hypothetical protein